MKTRSNARLPWRPCSASWSHRVPAIRLADKPLDCLPARQIRDSRYSASSIEAMYGETPAPVKHFHVSRIPEVSKCKIDHRVFVWVISGHLTVDTDVLLSRPTFDIPLWNLKALASSTVNLKTKSAGKRSMLRLTALFRLAVATPQSCARSASSITLCPRTDKINFAIDGERTSDFFVICRRSLRELAAEWQTRVLNPGHGGRGTGGWTTPVAMHHRLRKKRVPAA